MSSNSKACEMTEEELSFYTTFGVVKFRYLWTIKNFKFCEGELKPPIFAATALNKFKWQMTAEWSNGDFKLGLELISPESESILVNVSISTPVRPTNNYSLYEAVKGLRPTSYISMRRDEFPQILPITCRIEMRADPIHMDLSYNSDSNILQYKLCQDLSQLLDNLHFSDVTLNVSGTKFQAHKAILTSRSDVFAAMFRCNLKEGQTNLIDIGDIEPDVVAEMLRFIYSSKSPNLDQKAYELLVAANRYGLQDLKEMCAVKIAQSIAIDTVLEILVMADQNYDNQLKSKAMRFINNNALAIFESEDWEKLQNVNPQLCFEVYEWPHKQIRRK